MIISISNSSENKIERTDNNIHWTNTIVLKTDTKEFIINENGNGDLIIECEKLNNFTIRPYTANKIVVRQE